MKARNLLFSVILLGNLAVANTTVLAEETTGTVTAQTTSSSEIGIENDTESTLKKAHQQKLRKIQRMRKKSRTN